MKQFKFHSSIFQLEKALTVQLDPQDTQVRMEKMVKMVRKAQQDQKVTKAQMVLEDQQESKE